MARKKKPRIELRYYRMKEGRSILALLDGDWKVSYSSDLEALHFHNYMEIGYCYGGKGKLALGEQEFCYRGGEISVIPAKFPHATINDKDDVGHWEYLFVDVEGFLKRIYPNDAARVKRFLRRVNAGAYLLKAEEHPEKAEKVRRAIEIMRRAREFYIEEAEGVLLEFLARIARMTKDPVYEKEDAELSSGVVAETLRYIDDHYFEPLQTQTLADMNHISETHFRRVFKAVMGMSPLEYVNLIRIRAACDRLRKTDETMAVVASKCGFTSSSTFNRNFLRYIGATPTQWRRHPQNYERQLLKFEIHSEEGW